MNPKPKWKGAQIETSFSPGPHPDHETLSAYVDGQVGPVERLALEHHISGCQACRDEVADLFSVIAMLGGLEDNAPPRSFGIGEPPERSADQDSPLGKS